MLLNLSFLASPIFWIIAGIIALVAVFVLLWNKCEWFRNFWIGLWEGIKSILETAWNFIKGVFDAVIGFIKNNWQALLLMLVNPFAGAFKLIYDNCEPFRNFINNLVQTIIKWFNNFKTGIGNAVNGVVNFIKSIPGKIASIPGKIFNFFKSLPGKMLSIGLDIVKGIGKGITSGISWIKNKIKEFVGNVTGFIKKMFKIGSPSKLMANEIGQWIPKGIGVGITANTDAVNKSMANMQKEMMSTFQVSPQLANSAALHYSPTVVNNVQVNMTQDPLGQMVRDVKTFSGGSKNDYNYGMGV
jgi:phage-related protein